MAFLTDMNRMKRVVINTAAGGTIAAIAGVSGQTIRVYACELVFASSTTLDFKSAATSLTGPQTLLAKVLDFLRIGSGIYPRYVCASGETLNLVVGAAVQLSGVIYYTQD